MRIFETMKKALEKALAEDKFIGNYDYEDDNFTSYNLVDAVREAEEADDEYDCVEDFNEAIDEVVEENNLKLFSNDDNLPLFYCKPENKSSVVDFLRSDANINLHIFIEDGIYTDYLKRIGFLKYNEQYDEYIENEDYDGEEPQSFEKFFDEWLKEVSLI